jgi:hypothetical protein
VAGTDPLERHRVGINQGDCPDLYATSFPKYVRWKSSKATESEIPHRARQMTTRALGHDRGRECPRDAIRRRYACNGRRGTVRAARQGRRPGQPRRVREDAPFVRRGVLAGPGKVLERLEAAFAESSWLRLVSPWNAGMTIRHSARRGLLGSEPRVIIRERSEWAGGDADHGAQP